VNTRRLLLAAAALLPASWLPAATFTVSNTNDAGGGSLRRALETTASAPGPDKIIFASGLSGKRITLVSQLSIADSSGVTVDASALPAGMTLAGLRGDFRLMEVQAGGRLTLRGLTLTDGGGFQFSGYGAAIRNGGTLTLERCTLSNSGSSFDLIGYYVQGGAIYNDSGCTLTLTECTLSGNGGLGGGAIENSGILTLGQCTLSGNQSAFGGGAIVNDTTGTLTLTQCTLSGNSSMSSGSVVGSFRGSGGAIQNKGTLQMTQCVLSGNTGSYGGAIWNAGMLTLEQCTLSGNHSTIYGGAIDNDATGTLTLTQCTFSGNSVYGMGFFIGNGGAIRNAGALQMTQCMLSGNSSVYGGAVACGVSDTITRCTFSGNSAFTGGALYNTGSPVLSHCTFTGNHASHGGALQNDLTVTLTHCTFAGNAADRGILINNGTMALTHCTVAGNDSGDSGAITNNFSGAVSLTHTIVAGNLSADGENIVNLGTITRTGANLVQSHVNNVDGSDSGPAALTADPLLAPLADYGGPTHTMALRPGSPARDAAAGSTAATDQRGFAIPGVPDLGAYEAGALADANLAVTLAETLPNTGPAESVSLAGDFDGDGASNEQESAAGTNLSSASSVFRIFNASHGGGNLLLTFPTIPGRTYSLQQSDTLAPEDWINAGQSTQTGDGSVKSFTVPVGAAQRFYRVQSAP
jgi:hypothetical protein